MLCLLDLEQQLGIFVDIIKNLAAEIMSQIVEELRVFDFLKGVATFAYFGDRVLLILRFFIIFVFTTSFASLRQVLDFVLNLSYIISNNVQLVGVFGHVLSDPLDLDLRLLNVLRQLNQPIIVFLFILPDFRYFFNKIRSVVAFEILLLIILIILVLPRIIVLVTTALIVLGRHILYTNGLFLKN